MKKGLQLGLALVASVAVGCGGGTTTSAPSGTVGLATSLPTTAPSLEQPTPTAPPALVGTWIGLHHCQLIVEDLRSAGLDSQILQAVVGNGLLPGVTDPADVNDPDKPCVGAIDLEHAHFFNPAGEFGSLDQDGNPVDDGSWAIVDSTTFTINDIPFHYQVMGNELRLEPIDVGACPADPAAFCIEAWKVMVAMPGVAWTRRN